MKTRFPLFARLLLWFFVNLLVLIVGLLVMIRIEFGTLDNWLMPESSQIRIQDMSSSLMGDLVNSAPSAWTSQLAQVSSTYKMDFALYDSHAQWLAGSSMKLPKEVLRALTFHDNHPPVVPGLPGMAPVAPMPTASGPPVVPAGSPPSFDPHPGAPPGNPLRLSQGGHPPEFPKSVLRTRAGYWLMVRFPPEPFQQGGPVTLVGMTPALGISPLLFNPKPWLAVAVGVILFSILFWLPFARNLTNSIVKMTRATETIAQGRFDIQLADTRRDELGRLSHAINSMAGRLKEFVTGQKRFLGDAAHELCSPLARMEVALSILEERADEKSLPLVQDVREEVNHMRKLANDLLNFSKAALGETHLKLQAVSVLDVVRAAKGLEKSADGAIYINIPPDLKVWGNFELLHRAVANLLRNAARYAGNAGPISVNAWQEKEFVFITVSDQGPGVAAKDLEKLFDPFYRVDASRTFETGGVGLGLAIVKTCVESCRGVVTASNRVPHGLEVRIRLNRFAE